MESNALDKLKADLPDEIKGFYHYNEMAEKANEAHMEQGYHILKDIAKEEYIHAKHLKGILSTHNMLSPEHEKMFEDATAVYNSI